jgi:glycosyltransferase involved in cell wall biosynthesis
VTPDVSVTMAAWQPRRDWLLEAVESVLAESEVSLELIVVDDGSPEPVAGLLVGLSDERLRVERIEHQGTAGARNAGIAAAAGRLLRFVDADDVVAAGSTARLAHAIGDRDDVIAYGPTIVCTEDLRPTRTIMSAIEGDAVVPCLLGRFDVRHVSMLFPRRVVERAGPWRGGFALSEDWDFVLRTLEHGLVRGDPEPATFYRRHTASRTGVAAVEVGERDRRRIVDDYFDRHPELRRTALRRRAYAELHLDAAAKLLAAGDVRRGARSALRAVGTAPAAAAAPTVRLAARASLARLRT